jgi:hypothetical protein
MKTPVNSDWQITTCLSKQTFETAALARVPPGGYCVDVKRPWWRWWQPAERGGWLTVEREKNGDTSVMWTTNKDTHWPHGRWGCARSVTLGPDGALVAYFEGALSMWIKWGYGRGGDAELHRAIDFAAWAHSRLCGMPNTDAQGRR